MGMLDFFLKKDDPEKEIKKIIEELYDVQNTIVEFTNNTQLDKDIADMIGQLKAQSREDITSEKIIEFLVYLSDKTKTKSDSIQVHYSETMRKVIHAKIEMLIMYHTAISKRSAIEHILSVKRLFMVVTAFVVIVGIIVMAHKYDQELFIDMGISSRTVRDDGGNK